MRDKSLVLGLVFVLLASIVLLPACQRQAPKQAEVKTITFVAAQYSDKTPGYWQDVVKRFEEKNPGVKVDLQVIGWDNLNTKINSMVSSGSPPDVCNTSDWSRFAADKLLIELDQLLPADVVNKFIPSLRDSAKKDGHLYALPIATSVRVLFFNRKLFQQAGVESPPKTWDEIIEVSKKLAKIEGIYPFAYEMSTFEGHAFLSYFFWGAGGGWKDAQDKWAVDRPENVEALKFLADLTRVHKVTNPEPTAVRRDDLQQLFAAGKVGMLITASFFPAILKRIGPDVDYGVAPIPVKAGVPPVTLGVSDYIFAFNTTKHPDAVSKFLVFVFEDDNYLKFCQDEGMLPSTQAVASKMSEDPGRKQFIDLLPQARYYPKHDPLWSRVSRIVDEAAQQVILGQKAADVALKEAAARIAAEAK